MANEIRRTGDLRVKLSPDMLTRLEDMASQYGMPGATFAAFAIADYINRQETNMRMARMATMEMARNAGDLLSSGGGLDKILETTLGPVLAELSKQQALSQTNLPLEHSCTCKITQHERQENPTCPVHRPTRTLDGVATEGA